MHIVHHTLRHETDVLLPLDFDLQMRLIPPRFENLKAYFESFLWPMVEDTKAEICKSLQLVEQSSRRFALKCSIYELQIPQNNQVHMGQFDLKKFLLVTDLKHYNTQFSGRVHDWKHKKWDLVLMCTSLPKSFIELQDASQCYTLGVLTSSGGQSKLRNVPAVLKVTAFCPNKGEGKLVRAITRSGSKWYIVVLTNLSTALRTWDALNPDLHSALDRLRLVSETLYSTCEDQYQSTIFNLDNGHLGSSDKDSAGHMNLVQSIQQFCSGRDLNHSQTEAVVTTASALHFGSEPKVRLIKGPPGTGKTATVVTFLSVITCLLYRTLVCASANRAICEVAQRFVYLVNRMPSPEKSFQYYPFFTSYGCEGACKSLKLGDVVLVGNDERLEVDTTLSMIYLPFRVKRLSEAILHSRGWRQSLQNVLKLVKDPAHQFEAINKTREIGSINHARAFLQFFKEGLLCWGSQLILSGYIICRDLPKNLLNPAMSCYVSMTCAAVADALENLPSESDLSEEQAWSWFKVLWNPGAQGEYRKSIVGDSFREEIHMSLMLRKVHAFLSSPFKERVSRLLSSLNEDNLEDKCLQHACVVFCTIASAGRLCVQNSGPFKSLVIDEASQLVEAETAIVTQLPGLQQVLLVGDEKQLPATVVSMVSGVYHQRVCSVHSMMTRI